MSFTKRGSTEVTSNHQIACDDLLKNTLVFGEFYKLTGVSLVMTPKIGLSSFVKLYSCQVSSLYSLYNQSYEGGIFCPRSVQLLKNPGPYRVNKLNNRLQKILMKTILHMQTQ